MTLTDNGQYTQTPAKRGRKPKAASLDLGAIKEETAAGVRVWARKRQQEATARRLRLEAEKDRIDTELAIVKAEENQWAKKAGEGS